jgi:hypothetical protein
MKPNYVVEPTVLADLRKIEAGINTNDRASIEARWESGRKILESYPTGKKQLPKGLLDAIAHELGVARSEVGARIKFARKFPTKAKGSTVVETHTSWTAIRQGALTDTPRPRSGDSGAAENSTVSCALEGPTNGRKDAIS